MKFLVIILLSLALFACQYKKPKSEYVEALTVEKTMPLSPSIEKISFTTFDTINTDDYFSLKGVDSLHYFYNSHRNSLEVFLHCKPYLKIPLSKLSLKGDVTDVFLFNWDTIFVCQTGQISLIDTNCTVKKFWQLVTTERTTTFIGKFSDNFPVYYRPHDRCLYLERLYSSPIKSNNAASQQLSIEAKLNIDASFIDTLKIFPSRIYRNSSRYSFFTSRTVIGNKHVYSFPHDANIYVYHLTSDSVEIKGGKSKHQSKRADAYPVFTTDSNIFNNQLEALVVLPQYTTIQYNPATQFLYRMFLKEIDYKKDNQLYNTYRDKECYLMVMDTECKLLGEILLPNKYETGIMVNFTDGIGLISNTDAKSIEIEKYVLF